MGQQWRQVAAGLEAIRMTATNAILAATTEAEIIAIYATMQTSLSVY
jgi:hypothetical protein